ncbi:MULTISPECIES: DUF4240 domain-containing protein [Chryseobacterium]|jgi:hypothetical protein|uniref:DUF4240 domain-containing protein n=1 Tax=Chryseobacterium rhizosphaerae TaxID=395937 RepID=A0ABX9IMA1_9FLAO|nr:MULTISPECIES: DUF4240 domain-containing protein [Chryseobacterium]MBL3547312.1 DUF4240 domain-containing protein [Chryseobacterium sp. KMC2]MDC8099326.1 DUF4240 domain-containing protein [Chryseobacterium rhizosphaerae]MDR6546258.1 hypothetical protein [Chryseobacterium rhizosphaerae]REC75445.1 DUF4240 domain-containing protein [Chryseobacterium rhizosphaerae]SMC95862.1 Protein of unknown function [Chryseobacterium sp. YR221]
MENIETSEWFWSIIGRADLNRDKLKEILTGFSKEEIIKFQEEFVDASVELQDEPFIDYMEESEDGVEDIANWVVSNGKELYFQIMDNPEEIPHSVNDVTEQILYGVADEVCVEKYGESTGVY